VAEDEGIGVGTLGPVDAISHVPAIWEDEELNIIWRGVLQEVFWNSSLQTFQV
jgi:hypothetical protein